MNDPNKIGGWRAIHGWLTYAAKALGNPKEAAEFLDNNEWLLAWDALYEVALKGKPGDGFWENMACAAREMVE